MFDIRSLKTSPLKIDAEIVQKGKITIGDWFEWFWMPLHYWSLEQYKKQWKEGIEYLKTHDSSCLVVQIEPVDKEIDLMIAMWLLHKVDNRVYFQWHWFFNKENNLPQFTRKTCYQYIRSRYHPDGTKAEEWSTPLDEVLSYLHKK